MGKYFNNATLDGLWTRLVTRTEELCAEVIGTEKWVLTSLVGENEAGTVAMIYGQEYLCFGGDPGYLLDENTGEQVDVRNPEDYFEEMGMEMPEELSGFEAGLVLLYPLNKNHTYVVLNGHSDTREYQMSYKKDGKFIKGSMKEVHSALLAHFELAHDNAPDTPGDYMKGISVAANYYTMNNSLDIGTENTLERIVDRLEHSCHLSDDMVLTMDGYSNETGFALYDAETGEYLAGTEASGDDTFDLKDYYTGFNNGRKYYAVGNWSFWSLDEEEGSNVYWSYNIRSNEVVCNSTIDYVFTLSDDLYLTGNRYPDNISDIYLDLYRNNEKIGHIQGASGTVPYNFLDGDWSGSAPNFTSGEYYATVSWDRENGEYVTYTTNVVEFSGMAHVRITVKNSGMYASTNQAQGSSLSINGVTYRTPEEITVPIGTNIECSVRNNSGGNRSYDIYLNNVEVTYGIYDEYGASYVYTVKRDTDIVLSSGATMGQYGPTGETESISITEL